MLKLGLEALVVLTEYEASKSDNFSEADLHRSTSASRLTEHGGIHVQQDYLPTARQRPALR